MNTTLGTLTSLALYVALVAAGAVLGSRPVVRRHKLIWLGKLQFAALMVLIVTLGIKLGAIITPVVLLWYILTELGSIAENAEKMGAPVPGWIKRGLKQYRDKIDRDHELPGEEDDKKE